MRWLALLLVLSACSPSPEEQRYLAYRHGGYLNTFSASIDAQQIKGQAVLDAAKANESPVDRIMYRRFLIVSPTAPPACPWADKANCKDW